MDWNEHGGECCGMNHIHNFGTKNAESQKAELEANIKEAREESLVGEHGCDCDECMASLERAEDSPIAIECILTDEQLTRNDNTISKVLKEQGFILTARWLNPNSGNYCNQFVLCENTAEDSPFNKI